jgi:hypothetical protein
MNRTTWFPQRPERKRRSPKARLQVEMLETRNLLSSGLTLTPLVQVSDPSPLAPPVSSPTVFANSEVEPQIAVDPTNTAHAVAIWQQDRFRSVGGARALAVSVTYDANNSLGAHWSAPAAIPYFNATDPLGSAYARYTDPWVTIAANGDVYAVALAMTPVGPVPGHTAVQVSKSTNGGATWSDPVTLIQTDAPPGTDPADLANDKEMIVADPNNSNDVYVVWDRLNHPSDQQNFNAFHGLALREDAMFARTTDGGATWTGAAGSPAVAGFPASDLTNFQANESAFGNEIVVQPNGTLVDVFTHSSGSGNQAAQADQNVLGVLRSTDHGATWSAITEGPGIETVGVTDPDTGAPVRSGEPLTSVAVDPNNGNLYAVWADSRFSSKNSVDGVAFSMSTDGGLTWSDPIKVNQTPTNIPAGNQQAFTPNVAVNSNGTVAVSYYDFRNNDANPGLPTDYWLVHADSNFTDPSSWSANELRLTNASFNMENAAPTSRGYFLGDYEGLAAAGTSFYALFAQAGADSSDPSNIWFRDPPPAPDTAAAPHLAGDAIASHLAAKQLVAADLAGDLAGLVGRSLDTTGRGQATDGVMRSADSSSTDGRLIGQGAAVVPLLGDGGLAFQSGGFGETTTFDEASADLGDSPFADALGGDAGSPLAD